MRYIKVLCSIIQNKHSLSFFFFRFEKKKKIKTYVVALMLEQCNYKNDTIIINQERQRNLHLLFTLINFSSTHITTHLVTILAFVSSGSCSQKKLPRAAGIAQVNIEVVSLYLEVQSLFSFFLLSRSKFGPYVWLLS